MLLRRTLPAVLAALALAGCPSVDRDEPPARIAVATFDPTTGVIPTPNDLALQRAPAQVGLQQRLLLGFVANGGWPADQEVAVNIPVAVRTRQADGSYAQPAPAEIDLATVNDESVAFLQTNLQPDPVRILRCPTSGAPTATCWEPTAANGVLTLRRNGPDGHRRWDGGGRYVVALRNTLRTTDGLTLGADQAIALIAPNQSLTNPEFQPPGAAPAQLAPLEQLRGLYATGRLWNTVPDPAICAANGVPVAPCWLPLPTGGATGIPEQRSAFATVATVFPTAEMVSIQTFTVSGATFVRALTDSGSGQVPLPSDFLLDPATGRVRNIPAFGPAAAGLATLDGFSTTAPLLMPLTGAVKASTITRDTVRIYKVGTFNADGSLTPLNPPQQLRDLTALASGQTPQIVTQPPTAVANGASTTLVLAPAAPVQLPPAQGGAFVPVPPLDEKSQYLVVVTNGVLDAQDRPMRRSTLMDIVFSYEPPIFSASPTATDACPAGQEATCTSRIAGVAAADAAGLQRLRDSVGPVLDAFNLRSCADGATCAVLAYTVKTQSVKDVTKLLAAAPYGAEQAAGQAVFTAQGVAEANLAAFGIPAAGSAEFTAAFPDVARFVQFGIPSLYAIQGTTGAFDPAFATWTAQQAAERLQVVPVLAAIPRCAAPPCAAPLVVFQHGLNGARYQMIPIANELAARGFVVAAIDAPYHGDRAYCSSNAQCRAADGTSEGVCTPDPTLQTPSDTATVPGRCTNGSLAPDPTRLSTVASGNFFVSSNFFRIRDGVRQQALDLSGLVLALARPPAAAYPLQPAVNEFATALQQAGVGINPTQVYYAGLSLGGIMGTSFVATNPRFTRATLTAPGGTIVDIFTTAPAFQPQLAPLFAGLGIDITRVSPTLPGTTDPNPNFDPAVAARYAQTLAIAKWILDPADPVNYAANLVNKTFDENLQPFVAGGLGSATTAAYGQIMLDDQVVPNPQNRLLLGLAGIPTTTYDPTQIPPASRHGLLLASTPPADAVGAIVRGDLAAFLATPTPPPPATRTIP